MKVPSAALEWLALGDRIAEAKQAAGLPVPQRPKRRSTKRTPSRGRAEAGSK